MVKQYAAAHVFVCPSIIENSPNSVGEAQLVGTPCVASYVGGTMDMVKDGETGFLYRFEEISLLAKQICQIFSNDELAISLSENAHRAALMRHDKLKNATQLNSIYKQIINESILDL
jgi:glycosyltransferase involved in cell wall biosynthesis